MDALTDDQRETIIPRHYCVAGYKKTFQKCRLLLKERIYSLWEANISMSELFPL